MLAVTPSSTRYRIEDLARACDLSVDTIRYYQNLKLLNPPEREGRIGWYRHSHLKRLQQVQELSRHGFTLGQIRELDDYDPLLQVLAVKTRTTKTYTRAQLAKTCGLEPAVVDEIIELGLILPLPSGRAGSGRATSGGNRQERFSGDAAEMLLAASALMEAGIDAVGLFELAVEHASQIQASVDKAIELFVAAAGRNQLSKADIARQLEQLLPQVVKLVARHFSQTLLAHSSKLIRDGVD